jgi:hypothetical protein
MSSINDEKEITRESENVLMPKREMDAVFGSLQAGVGIDGQPLIRERDLRQTILNYVLSPEFMEASLIKVKAFEHLKSAPITTLTDLLVDKYAALNKARARLCREAEEASSASRVSIDKLNSAIDKITTAMGDKRLDKAVDLMERMAVAMKTLNDIESTGRLDKILLAMSGAL